MANDYSQFQGSDYYHAAEPPKQNNLLDGLTAALQTFAAIRSGKKKIDRENEDRETNKQLLGYKLRKEEADINETNAKANYYKTQSELYGKAKEQTSEKRDLTLQQVELAKAKIAALKIGDPLYDAKVAEILSKSGLTDAKTGAVNATMDDDGSLLPKEESDAKKSLMKSQENKNNAAVTVDPKTGLTTLASGKGSGAKATGYTKKHDDAFKAFVEGVSENKTQERSDTSMTGTVEFDNPKAAEFDNPKAEEYVKSYVGRQQALDAYESLEQMEKDGVHLDPTQKRRMADLAGLLKLQTEEQLPESPLLESVKKFETSKLKPQMAMPPKPGEEGFEQYKKDRQPPPTAVLNKLLGAKGTDIKSKAAARSGFEAMKNPEMNRASVFASGNVGKPTMISALTGKFQDKGEQVEDQSQKSTVLMNPSFGVRIEPKDDGSNIGEVLGSMSNGGDYTKEEVDFLLAELVSSKTITKAVADDILEKYKKSHNFTK